MTEQAATPLSIVGRLREALGEFFLAWRRKRARVAAPVRNPFPAFASLALCGGIAAAAYWFDVPGLFWARERSLPVIHAFATITKLGESGYVFVLTALTGVVAVLARRRGAGARVDAGLTQLAARAMFLFDVAAVSGIASQVVKHLFGRARPKLYDAVGAFHFDVFSIYASYASFPSGHAVTAFAMVVAVWFLSPLAGAVLLPAAVAVAASRVVIGAHYTSDVLAGAALGVGSAFLLRREFAVRGIVFAETARGLRLRGRGVIWPAMRGYLDRRSWRRGDR